MHYVVKPCKTAAAYEILIDKKLVEACIKKARAHGFQLVADTPFVKIMKKDIRLSFFSSGRILVEGLADRKQVEEFFREHLL